MSTEKPAILMYAHPMCPLVYPLMTTFKKAGVNYEYIDIHQDEDARQRVRDINNGDESVPTLVFPDGSTLTEPWPNQINAKLRQMGYRIGWQARAAAYSPRLALFAGMILVLLRATHRF